MSYNDPIYMSGAAFQYMYDGYGNTFLDAYNNIPHVGHSHPKVVAAGQKQMATLNTNTRYLYDLLSEYAEVLLQRLPKKLNKVFSYFFFIFFFRKPLLYNSFYNI